MKLRIYIGCNNGLPNIRRSLSSISTRIDRSGISKDDVQTVESDPDRFEYPALNRLWLDSQVDDFYGLYLHCKGASKENEMEFQNGLAWMHYMLYGVLDNYKLCLEHMDKGADLVGAMWYRHFKGNFFWFKSSYVKKLAGPYDLDISNRFHAEYWCAQAFWYNHGVDLPRTKNLFYMPIRTDSDFLRLKANGYVPDLNERVYCTSLAAAVEAKDYVIYNNLILSRQDYEENKHEADKFINYDSVITVIK